MRKQHVKRTVLVACLAGLFLLIWNPLIPDKPIASAAAKTCDQKSIAGKWQRIHKKNKSMDAFWTFAGKGKISCSGRDCARAGGKPMLYAFKSGLIAIAFERGLMKPSKCKVTRKSMFVGGGADSGGFTFARQ